MEEIIKLIVADPRTGVIVVLVIVWIKELRRAERLEQERAALLERVLTALNTAAFAVTGATASIDSVKNSISTFIDTARRQL